MLWLAKLSFGHLAAMPDVHAILAIVAGLPYVLIVVAFVCTEVLRFVRRWLGPICQQTVPFVFGQRVVVFVGSSQDQTERYPFPIRDETPFCSEFAAVNGAGAGGLPPKGAGTVAVSTICRSQSIPLRSS